MREWTVSAGSTVMELGSLGSGGLGREHRGRERRGLGESVARRFRVGIYSKARVLKRVFVSKLLLDK